MPSNSFSMRDDYTSELPPFALQQMQHNTSHVEDINMKMRIPSKLTVAYHEDEDIALPNGDTSYSMEVPEKIVVSVGDGGVQYSGPKDMSRVPIGQDLGIDGQPEPVSLLTPPRKLTLAERNLDALDVQSNKERSNSYGEQSQRNSGFTSASEQHESTISEEQDDVAVLRRQIFKLHRRITTIEKEQSEKSKREAYVYAVSIALLFVNGWLLYTSRKV